MNQIFLRILLLSLNNSTLFNHKLNACYGTNKYCNSFLKGIECNNKDCFYLHEKASKNDIIIKNDTQMKAQFIEQQKIATKIADIFSPNQKEIYLNKGLEIKKEFKQNKIENYFPTIDTIYENKFIQEFKNIKDLEDNTCISYYNKNKKLTKEYYYKPSSPNKNYSKINNDYSSPQIKTYNDNNSNNLIEDEEENEEYILVKQPSRHKKKYAGNKNTYKRNYYKKNNFKLKFTLEKYKIKYNIKEEEKNSSSPIKENNEKRINKLVGENNINEKNNISINANSQPISGYNTNESSCQNNQQEEMDLKKNFYKNYKKSRFSFIKNELENNEQNEKFVVPIFINDILNKKINSLSFARFIKNNERYVEKVNLENFLLYEEINVVNKWAGNC